MASPSASSSPKSSVDATPRRVKAGERTYKSEMMFIGQRCHWHECNREDFLPFRCGDCHNHFCSQHFRAEQHNCPSSQAAYVIPLCPICHEPPKNWKRDEDPNVAMNAHLTPDARSGIVECPLVDANGQIRSAAAGKGETLRAPQRTKRPNECSERRCTKLMVVPIECPACKSKFCPSHRAPEQHSCAGTQSYSRSGGSIISSWQPRVKVPSAKQNGDANASATSSKSSIAVNNPIKTLTSAATNLREGHKMDKRAREERASLIKSLQARRAKGILTSAEEVRLAEEMAKMHTSDRADTDARNKDCVVC